MTRKEAKRELRKIKGMETDIRALELEIERLMTIATKMTQNYSSERLNMTAGSRVEEAVIQIEEYRDKLSKAILEDMKYKNRCLEKVRRIEPSSLQKILIIYYFQNKTLSQTAEEIGKSDRWTRTMFQEAVDKYSKIS